MINPSEIREHMEVRSSDDHHVGRVDKVLGSEIELSMWDFETRFKHRLIPITWVDHVDKHVYLNMTRDLAEAGWVEKSGRH